MQKYVASPNAEVIGSAMQNFFVSLNKSEFAEIVETSFKEYGLDKIDADTWYPHQLTLDIFRKIEAQDNLVALGMAYVETALFPPEINSIDTALILLGQTYHLNIRNAPEGEGYSIKILADNQIQIHDNNPFPHDTVYGFIWGICKRFRAENQEFVVKRTYLDPENPNDAGAIYDVFIKPKY